MEEKPDESDTTIFYSPDIYSICDDGTIEIKVSIWDSESHSSAAQIVPPDHPEYAFWRWIAGHRDYRRTLNKEELSEAKNRFALESNLE